MEANYVQRLRLTFSKTGPTRYIGHLDLARTLERSLNRARIPMAYTLGFNPRPRMQLAAALPLGFTSEHEIADILLMERMAPIEAQQQIMNRMAPGIDVYQVEEVSVSAPALQTITQASVYRVTLLDPVDNAALQQRINALLAAESHMRVRARGKKRKPYDLRPLIINLSSDLTEDTVCLDMELYLMPSKTGRPDEVLLALDLDPLATRIHRMKIVLSE